MALNYLKLGEEKKLNEIVLVGSHDAGITAGAVYAQTQTLDIHGQALAGVRFFDLRIAAFSTGSSWIPGSSKVELKAFHADDALRFRHTSVREVVDLPGSTRPRVESSKLLAGAQGLGLYNMLLDAKKFVTDQPGEFLILKFDKCTNWALIADMCIEVLKGIMYVVRGNINKRSLSDLRGKVVVAFMEEGYKLLTPEQKENVRLMVNLYKGGTYLDDFNGLQYWGSGGTSATNLHRKRTKINENIVKQTRIIGPPIVDAYEAAHAGRNAQVMGMMYWTSTGLFSSIRARDSLMWNLEIKKDLSEFVRKRMPPYMNTNSPASASAQKRFMPNIVMIDFADESRCKEIYDFNTIPALQLSEMPDQGRQ